MSEKTLLEESIDLLMNDLIDKVRNDKDMSVEDKLKVLDKATKWQSVKFRYQRQKFGEGFGNPAEPTGGDDDDDEDADF